MPDLTTRLREDFEETARHLTPPDHLDDLVRRRRRQHLRRRRGGVSGGLVVAGVAAALVATRLLPGGDDPSSVVAGSSEDVVDGAPLFLVPDAVPSGFELLEASGGDLPGITVGMATISDWQNTQRWVRYDEAREHPTDILDLRWSHVRTDGSLAPDHSRPVTLPDDSVAQHNPDDYEVYKAFPDQSLQVSVRGIVAPATPDGPTDPLPLELMTAAMASFEERDGSYTLASPPEGFELAGQWTRGGDGGTNGRVLAYGDPAAERGFQMQVVDDSGIPPAASLDSADDRVVTVRGNEALLSQGLLAPPSFFGEGTLFLASADRYLQWIEPGGERVTITARGLSDDEVLAVAESLEPVDAPTWFALQDTPESESPATTDTTETTDTTDTPQAGDASAAPAGTEPLLFAGTYEGSDRYTLSSEGPCDLDHDDEATFTLTDGSTWQFQHDQCAQVVGNIWSATGTFTFTLPDGATLSGTNVQDGVPLPTTGAPFDLDITDGSGRFAGATGSCTLDNHLEETTLGQQRLYGTFTCDVTT